MKRGKGKPAAPPTQRGQGRAPRRDVTPARPVVNLALLLFLPALLLVVDGNLSVQTALVRFGGALLVSWVAAWLVHATVRSARTARTQQEAAAAADAERANAEAAAADGSSAAGSPVPVGAARAGSGADAGASAGSARGE